MNIKIGERLEEARKRQGISISDASQAIKIRSDFLLNFENNHFGFDLPEVYKQGFLKIYARFLKLDPDKILTEYKAFYLNIDTQYAKKEVKESYGKISLGTTHPVQEESIADQEERTEPEMVTSQFTTKFKEAYIKFALVGIITLAILISIGYRIYRSKSHTYTADNQASIQTLNASVGSENSNPAYPAHQTINPQTEELVIVATGDVKVIVREEINKKRIYSGELIGGDKTTLQRKGPIKIHFSEGTHLVIERANGEKLRPGRPGSGWIELN
jgi:cytoskeleton protein RodZ